MGGLIFLFSKSSNGYIFSRQILRHDRVFHVFNFFVETNEILPLRIAHEGEEYLLLEVSTFSFLTTYKLCYLPLNSGAKICLGFPNGRYQKFPNIFRPIP